MTANALGSSAWATGSPKPATREPVRLPSGSVWSDDALLDLLGTTADAIAAALGGLHGLHGLDGPDARGAPGERPGQYRADLVADAAALDVLGRAGVNVLSEESGSTIAGDGSGVTVVVDPLDGSTNASRAIPWYATSLCAVDGDGARAALVVNLVSKDRFTAVRGGGAHANGRPLKPSGCTCPADAIVGLSDLPARHLGWGQFRALGAIALDLCAVASGTLDGYVDCSDDAHGVWDYLGAMLVCLEAGAGITDLSGRELTVLDVDERRTPVAGATPELLNALLAARALMREL